MTVSLVSSSVLTRNVGIFLAEPGQRLAHFVRPFSAGGIDRHFDDGVGDEHAFERAILVLRGVGIAAGAIDAHHGHDVAGTGRIDFRPLIGVHLDDAAEPLLLTGALVEEGFALLDRALVNPHESQLTERILDDLERHADERLRRIGFQFEHLVGMFPVLGLDRPIERRRQISSDGVEQ